MSTDTGTLALGALADAVVVDILRGDDLQYSIALRHAADLLRDDGPLGLWGQPREDRAALQRFAPRPGHKAHLPIAEVHVAVAEMRLGGGSDHLRSQMREFFGAVAASTLAATAAPGCGSAPRT